MIGVNLIPESRRAHAAKMARIRTWGFVLAGTVVLSASGATVFRAAWSLERGPLQPQILAAREAAAASDAQLIKLRGEIATLRKAMLAARMVGEHPDWSLLLRAINQVRGDNVALQTFEIRAVEPGPAPAGGAAPNAAEKYTVKVRGIATDLSQVMGFIHQLEQLGALDSVAMKQSRAELLNGVTVTGFDIECALMEGPALTSPPTEAAATAATEDQR